MVRSLPTPIALLAVAALAIPTAGHAAEPDWDIARPLTYGTPTALPGIPSVTLNADGLGVAVSDVGGAAPAVGPHSQSSAFTNGVFLDPQDFGARSTAFGPGSGGVASYAHTGLLAAGLTRTRKATRVVLAIGRLSPNRATLTKTIPVGPATGFAYAPAFAVDDAGDAVAVYPVCADGSCRRSAIYLTARKAGSSRPTTTRIAVTSGTLPRVAAAIDQHGDALAVWTQDTGVYARTRTASGRLRATQRAGTTRRGSLAAPSAALSNLGAELIGWSTQTVSEGDPSAGNVVLAQARTNGPYATKTVATLPAISGDSVTGPVVRVAIDPQGQRHVAWTGYAGDPTSGHFTVTSALVSGPAAHGPLTLNQQQLVSDPAVDSVLGDLATTAGGKEVIAVRAGIRGDVPLENHATIEVATRPSITAPFTRTTLSARDGLAEQPAVALQPGRALVVWGTSGQSGAQYAERIG